MKLRKLLCVLIMLAIFGASGCRSDDDQLDELWEQGHGFNNPNAERIKKEMRKDLRP